MGWRRGCCVRVRGGNTPPGLSMCRRSNTEGPVSPLGSSVARCPGPDGLRVSPQKGTWGSHVRESGRRRTICGVGEVSWRVAGKMRPFCSQVIGLRPSSSCPSVDQTRGEGPLIVLWGSGDRVRCWSGRCCLPILLCTSCGRHN